MSISVSVILSPHLVLHSQMFFFCFSCFYTLHSLISTLLIQDTWLLLKSHLEWKLSQLHSSFSTGVSWPLWSMSFLLIPQDKARAGTGCPVVLGEWWLKEPQRKNTSLIIIPPVTPRSLRAFLQKPKEGILIWSRNMSPDDFYSVLILSNVYSIAFFWKFCFFKMDVAGHWWRTPLSQQSEGRGR